MNTDLETYRKPAFADVLFNRIFGLFLFLGIGLPHNFLVEVRGRRSGRVYTTPVNLLRVAGKRYIVAPRGETEWIKNARAAGELYLKKAFWRFRYKFRELSDDEKPRILQKYLVRFFPTVQRYFPIRFWSKLDEYTAISSKYPVLELQEYDELEASKGA